MRYGHFGNVAKKPYPKGPAYPIDDAWRARVLARMAEMNDMKKGQLAKVIGCDPSAITVLFRSTTIQTRMKPEIHAALGWEPPAPPDGGQEVDEVEKEMVEVFASLSDDDRRHLLYMARRMLGKSSR